MSNVSSPNANTLSFTSASDLTPTAINLDSSLDDSSIQILDNSAAASAENTLLAGGDSNRNTKYAVKTPLKGNSNDFIRNEIVTSTPVSAASQNVVSPKSDGKRKRVESPELMVLDDDSGEGVWGSCFECSGSQDSVSSSRHNISYYYSVCTNTGSDEETSTSNTDASTVSVEVKLDDRDTFFVKIEPLVKYDRGTANYDPATGIVLPDTVTLLTTPAGSRVYLVGTAHFSKESQDDVSLMIRAVNPNIVCIELCRARRSLLELDEKTILEEAKNINMTKIRNAIQQNGLVNGLVYILLLNMSAHLTKQLGVVPGGEFRRAVAEVRQLPNCMIHLSDRPLDITIKRALHSLSWWQTVKLAWHLVTSNDPISMEEVEKCKQRDLLEEMLKEMCGEYPEMGTVFLQERDIYLTYSLQLASLAMAPDKIPRVVAVVGIGHVPGIVERWGRVTQADVEPLMIIPEPTRTSKVIKFALKASLVGGLIYAGYRIMPINYIRAMVK